MRMKLDPNTIRFVKGGTREVPVMEPPRIRDEYLLGRDILVAPVLEEGAVSRSVYLPEDIWVDFWTKEEYRGGHYTVQAPLGRIPVFVRKGAALFG